MKKKLQDMTIQDAFMFAAVMADPEKCRKRLVELLRGLTSRGYGLHLFEPEWFEPEPAVKPFKSLTTRL